jgi:GntR family transcriptional regulator, transcriptional repressor for pyruvate dehydrogenase complex
VSRSKATTGLEVWERSLVRVGVENRAAEEIAQQIQEVIVGQDLPEGLRLPSERDLAEMLFTSRPTVSQAIRILIVRGMVESRRGSGAYVLRRPEASLAASMDLMLGVNQHSVSQLADLRLWLEDAGVREAVQRRTPVDVNVAHDALERLRQATGSTASWLSADAHFHATLVRASHNSYLASIFEGVHTALMNYEYRQWIASGTVPSWLGRRHASALAALHEPILLAVRDRDADAGRRAVLHHHHAMEEHLAASVRATSPGRRRAAREV